MKQKNTQNKQSNDVEVDVNLQDLIKKGFIKEYVVNGEVIYGITELGDTFVEEQLPNKGTKDIEELP